jgi:hypothetical protein
MENGHAMASLEEEEQQQQQHSSSSSSSRIISLVSLVRGLGYRGGVLEGGDGEWVTSSRGWQTSNGMRERERERERERSLLTFK